MDDFDPLTDGRRVENLIQRTIPGLTTEALVDRLMTAGELITGNKPYPYQIPFIRRCFEVVLEREAEEITCLMARQSGKSESVNFVISTLMVFMPVLSAQFPEDDRFNFFDVSSGTYRSYKGGFWVMIFAPKKEQAGIIFNRIKKSLSRDKTIQLLQEIGITYQINNGDTFRLSNGSFVRCSTASDQASIEGATLHLAILEESQDISDEKANKSIAPMMASTGGSMIKIGTANARKSHYYLAIRRNERRHAQGAPQNHFSVAWREAVKFNKFYHKFIMKEMSRLGETSDEFLMNFDNRFMLERGLAVSEVQFNNRAVTEGIASDVLPGRRIGMHYVAGIDFGKLHDSTVVTILEVNWDNPREVVKGFDVEEGGFEVEIYGKHVVGWLELQGDDYEAQYVQIKNFLIPWGVERICLDATGVGESLGDRFKGLFDSVDIELLKYSDDSKDALGREFLADLHNGMVTWPGGPECQQRRTFKNFKIQMLDLEKDYRNNLLNLHHPDMRGAKDDFPQSLMMAIRAANSKPFGGEIEQDVMPIFRRSRR